MGRRVDQTDDVRDGLVAVASAMGEYKQGDVVNGHVLGTDNVWHPLPVAAAKRRTYKQRYLARYRWTWGVYAVLAIGSQFSRVGQTGRTPGLIDVVGTVLLAAVFALVFNLAVAAVPDRQKR